VQAVLGDERPHLTPPTANYHLFTHCALPTRSLHSRHTRSGTSQLLALCIARRDVTLLTIRSTYQIPPLSNRPHLLLLARIVPSRPLLCYLFGERTAEETAIVFQYYRSRDSVPHPSPRSAQYTAGRAGEHVPKPGDRYRRLPLRVQ